MKIFTGDTRDLALVVEIRVMISVEVFGAMGVEESGRKEGDDGHGLGNRKGRQRKGIGEQKEKGGVMVEREMGRMEEAEEGKGCLYSQKSLRVAWEMERH